MGRIISSATTSLDGYVAYPDDTVGSLFDWYDNGDVEVENAGDLPPFHLTEASARYWIAMRESLGALVCGRTLFDITDGWKGRHPLGVPVVVLTHEPPADWSYPGSEEFRFVTTGIDDALDAAQDIAGDRVVGVAAGTVATQAFRAGRLDEVRVDLVPIFLGGGKRYFSAGTEVRLGEPTEVVEGRGVRHFAFPVDRGADA